MKIYQMEKENRIACVHAEIFFENFFDGRANFFGHATAAIISSTADVKRNHHVENSGRDQIFEFGVLLEDFKLVGETLESRAVFNQFAQRFFKLLDEKKIFPVVVAAPGYGIGRVAANVINFRRLDINLCQKEPV